MQNFSKLATNHQENYQVIEINPYKVLDLDEDLEGTSKIIYKSKFNFLEKISNEKLTYFQRKRLALARQILMKPKEYLKINGEYKYIYIQNIFHNTVCCDFKQLVPQLQNEIQQKLEMKDEREQGLLYLATQPGYKIMILYLLQKGVDINQTQINGSTPLHIACYNGHVFCVDILLLNGADMNIKNQFGNYARDESYKPKKQKILDLHEKYKFLRENNQIYKKIHDLRQKKMISLAYTLYSKEGQDIGIFVQPNYNNNPVQKQKLILAMSNPNYSQTFYHGTQIKFLDNILQKGLLKPSQRGDTNLGSCRIPLGEEVNGIKNWADAVFVSSSPYYASHGAYSQYFDVQNIIEGKHVHEKYALILQVTVRSNNPSQENIYQKFKHTLQSYDYKPNEPELVEYRVTDTTQILVSGIYFLNKKYLTDLNSCKDAMKLLNEKGKIDGIYCNDKNTYKVTINNYWELCLMGHTLQKSFEIHECDVCGVKQSPNHYCDKCSFTRCPKCKGKCMTNKIII
ncbi:Ankyrin repeat-containing domain [Pseudocohnilembus persalinus]|uniref:Ankyrin repeat-containing domain n=1 Tax=Pseudocohnilembus persalinus TaxID=266149 RepID=A0A0V0QED0_PSEPJ|nr:Ankyrin repeat-containing domain [Pseudocohnilembus persalinus]|eukprot:KRX00574.1 Ankyrin repeat-containing domain [Pseudocohnilembus persalinus]